MVIGQIERVAPLSIEGDDDAPMCVRVRASLDIPAINGPAARKEASALRGYEIRPLQGPVDKAYLGMRMRGQMGVTGAAGIVDLHGQPVNAVTVAEGARALPR